MSCKNGNWQDKLIEKIRLAGLSIADNAEKIANDYEYMIDTLEVTATFSDRESPSIEVRQRFIPETYIHKLVSENKH